MANKDFRLTAVLAVRDTLSPVLAAASKKWEGFQQTIESTEYKKFTRQLKLANRALGEFSRESGDVAAQIAAPFAAIAGTVGFSIQSAVTGFAQVGDGLDKMSARLGISAVKLQEWSFAATHAGAAPEDLEDALKDLSEKIAEVAAGDTGDAAQLFEALGISVKDAAGKIRPSVAIFEEVADAIQRNEDPALRTKMAMVLMGDSGRKLIPMLSGGAKGLEDMAKQAHELGLVMDEDAVATAAKLTDHMDDMKASVASVGHEIGYRLSPVVISMADRFRDLAAANKGAFGEKVEKVALSLAEAVGQIDFEALATSILTIADYSIRAFNAVGGFNTVLYGMGALIAGKSVMAVVSLGSSLFGLVQSFGAVATAAKVFAAAQWGHMIPSALATLKTLGSVAAFSSGVLVSALGSAATMAASAARMIAGAFITSLGPAGLVLGAISVAAGLMIANWDRVGPRVKKIVGGIVDFAKAAFDLIPESWKESASSWYESVKESVIGVGKIIKDFISNFDFASLMPDWAKKLFGVEPGQMPLPARNASLQREGVGFGEPTAFLPDQQGRMTGEMVVRVAATPGTTAQLDRMSSDGMKLTGNVGYSDRYLEDSF